MMNSIKDSLYQKANMGPKIVMPQKAAQNRFKYIDLVKSLRSFRSANAFLEKKVIYKMIISVNAGNFIGNKMLQLKSLRNSIWILSILAISFEIKAKDFGTAGHVYNIAEQPFLEMLKERLEKVDIEKEQKKMQAKAKERVENPKPVAGIVTATRNRSWYWDPTYVVAKDIILPCGKILHKAGTKLNPLDHMDFDRKLFFIKANDDEQVSFLLEQISQDGWLEERIILTSGSPMKLKEELLDRGFKHNIYFDQFGELTGRFGIRAVPAIALQEGQKIRINEISMD